MAAHLQKVLAGALTSSLSMLTQTVRSAKWNVALKVAFFADVDADSDDDFKYEEVELEHNDDDESDNDRSEDLEATMRSLQKASIAGSTNGLAPSGPLPAGVTRRPEVIDDFIRNFLVKGGLNKTLETFEMEWYQLSSPAQSSLQQQPVADVYVQNQQLEAQLRAVQKELDNTRAIAEKTRESWDKIRKERDSHRMHHKRVAQEKNKLITDIKRLKAHYAQYEPTLRELKAKYESLMKEKTLTRLERDRLAAKVEALEAMSKSGAPSSAPINDRVASDRSGITPKPSAAAAAKRTTTALKGDAILPPNNRPNPLVERPVERARAKGFKLAKTFKGHHMPVSNLRMHPKKPIVATSSDDATWKLWSLPSGELIMSGDGHKDWVSGIDFHPSGTMLASSSGDCTVKLWSFEQSRCIHTFGDHTQAVWNVAYHDTGDFLSSCSLDHSARLWDLSSMRCRQTFRGHVDSVNETTWQPYTNVLCTASSDKTVSLWDARTSLCLQTFYGHSNSCNHAAFNPKGDTIASVDADGVVKLWDVRMVTERLTINVGPHPANKAAFDPSGEVLAIASEDGSIKCFQAHDSVPICELRGHEDAVQCLVFDNAGKYLVSGGSDHTFRLWSC
ncbi:WD-40 repeat domain-containing protein [Klebsormidium nitens]|uniref:WD-40 repeat domain-containing protein n=1 Tax=Klebsormidium nitens TaxID=105231 RepID=A0A1Y1HQZ5_KLENI|nr:WD-40 repeat domain-containing protein [Klebsormidium nitens]|eukprot:GAQ78248.1 WD-40 repeat domain-containing protein [Klebsormidium nitens]